jgi:hypothetical protein
MPVNDTSISVVQIVAERHRAMTPEQRMLVAASLFEVARAIVESSLPPGLSPEERRGRMARRIYRDELPAAAISAHATFHQNASR